jgi:hypothetical protein
MSDVVEEKERNGKGEQVRTRDKKINDNYRPH